MDLLTEVSPQVLICQNEVPMECTQRALELAQAAGVKVRAG
jgi:hypothetical protein